MKKEFSDLLHKYLANSITKEEEERLIALAAWDELAAQLEEHLVSGAFTAEEDAARHEQIYARLNITPVRRLRWLWGAAAAVVIAASTYLLWPSRTQPSTLAGNALEQIMPAGSGAILTLANGTELQLDSLKNGIISSQNGTTITLQGKQVSYQSTGEAVTTAYNTIRTPNGSQFRLTLPDGSKVWLNALSSVRYPTHFNGKERQVSISGEAYFEVAQNAQQPFKVTLDNGSEVQVLGTSFSIKSYADEPALKTTLLAGSIRLSNANGTAHVIMKPGEQTVIAGYEMTTRAITNADDEIAWINGRFAFRDADIYAVARELARWYNVEIRFDGKMPDQRFNGKIEKSLSLGQVLNGLTRTRVKYRIDGNTITLIP